MSNHCRWIPRKKYCFLYYFSIEFPSVSLMPLYYIKLSSQQHHQIRMRTRRSLFCNAHWFFSYASHWFSVGSFFRFQFIQAATRERETEKKLKRQLPYFVKCLVHKRIFIENKRIKFNEGIGTSFNWHSPQQLFTRKSHEKHE